MKIPTRKQEAGFISVEIMVAVALSMVFLVFLLNLLFIGYGKGVVRAAADEGARAGSRIAVIPPQAGAAGETEGSEETAAQSIEQDIALSTLACQQRAASVMESLGKMATRPVIVCNVDMVEQRITATVSATFEGWVPPVPDIDTTANASVNKEVAPE